MTIEQELKELRARFAELEGRVSMLDSLITKAINGEEHYKSKYWYENWLDDAAECGVESGE